jgi:hypothetical protein
VQFTYCYEEDNLIDIEFGEQGPIQQGQQNGRRYRELDVTSSTMSEDCSSIPSERFHVHERIFESHGVTAVKWHMPQFHVKLRRLNAGERARAPQTGRWHSRTRRR